MQVALPQGGPFLALGLGWCPSLPASPVSEDMAGQSLGGSGTLSSSHKEASVYWIFELNL